MDESEFRRFVTVRGTALCRSAYLLTGDWHLGEDLVQTALAHTWGRRRHLRNPEALEAYVRRCIVRASISWRRRRSSSETPVEHAHERTDDDPAPLVLERQQMWAALRELPAKQRAVLVLRYYEDLSEQQIADALDCSIGTVKSHTSRAMKALRGPHRAIWETADEQN